jgi:dihydropyrimidine dehydrogenase (NAD+) subunit PreA
MLMKDQIKRSDMISCLLCKDAPCSEACGRFEPGEMLRSIWFDDWRPKLDGSKCVGCHLCVLVCPRDAIAPGRKRIKR